MGWQQCAESKDLWDVGGLAGCAERVESQESMVDDLAGETKGGRCMKKGKQMRISVVSEKED